MKARVRDEQFIFDRVTQDPETGCWNWQGSINVAGRAVYNATYAYRISYEIFIGAIGNLQINHHCDNPRCVNPDHVYAGTQKQNTDDAIRRGRLRPPPPSPGESHYLAYSDATVDLVRARYAAGEMQKDLAAEMGISLATIREWVSGGGRNRQPIRRQPAPCGTRAGYCAHKKRKEPACDPCRKANTSYLRTYKAARRLRSAA